MNTVLLYVGAVCFVGAALVLLVASVGVLLFNDIFTRMHAAAKPQWLGVFLIALGLVCTHQTWQWFYVSMLIVLFQTLSAPVGSHLLGRSASRSSELNTKD